MELRTATMSLYNSDQPSERWHLLRKLVLLFLLVTALALGLVILLRQKVDFPLLWFNLLADASLGLVAGVGARVVLRQRNWFIRGLAAAAMALVGLGVLGYFTDWRSGIGPLPAITLTRVNWSDPTHIPWASLLRFRHTNGMNLLDLAHMIVAMDASWIALRAWTSPTRRLLEPSVRASRRIRSRQSLHTSASSAVASLPGARVSGSSSRPRIKRAKYDRASASTSSLRSRRWNPLQRKPDIQLAVYEEHRCPYCFEEVKRNDPRGVVECEVCHTLHHKDCWDVTGICQVPHLNT
jgi:ribosomal protein L37AE/L43A